MKYSIENPTGKKKAVREDGGLTVVLPGQKVTAEAEWTDAEVAKYEAAGLKIGKASGRSSGDNKGKE